MDKKKQNKYTELSALIDADSFFYGLYSEKGLERVAKESVIESENMTFDVASAKVGIRSDVFVHVPTVELQLNKKKSFLVGNPNYDKIKNPIVLVDKISDSISTIWAIEKSDLANFKIIDPTPNFFHYSTAFIKLALQSRKEGVFVNFVDQVMDIVVIKRGELQYYNRNKYFAVSDVLYYILLAFKRGNLNEMIHHLYLMGEIKINDDIHNSISEYITHISFLSPDSPMTYTEDNLYHEVAPIHAVSLCGS